MADHEELLSEMELIERLPTQERLKQAKRRRALQLKRWSEAEKESIRKDSIQIQHQHQHHQQQQKTNINSTKGSIKFQDHVMLLDAVMRKDYNEVKRLLELGVNPNLANEDGLTAIHQCCIDDSPEILTLLIQHGANVNICDNDLWTPLHAAATCANLDICKILISNNAELLAVNTDGNMPYDICDDETCLEYIESEMANRGVTQQTIDIKRAETEITMLQDIKLSNLKGKDLNFTHNDQNGATLMHISCANGYTSVLQYLLENKASLNVRDNDGWTPLHVATFWGHQKAIELLIEYGADIYAKTYNEETVFDLSDDIDLREFIVQKKKEVENNEKTNRTTSSIKRTSTGVSRSSSVRRSSFRDKEKCRKLDTSFKDVLYANECKFDDLESEEFQDKSLPNYIQIVSNENLDRVGDNITQKPPINNENSFNTLNTNNKNNNNINKRTSSPLSPQNTTTTSSTTLATTTSTSNTNTNSSLLASTINNSTISRNNDMSLNSTATINNDNNNNNNNNNNNQNKLLFINETTKNLGLNSSIDYKSEKAKPTGSVAVSSITTNNSNITSNSTSNMSNNSSSVKGSVHKIHPSENGDVKKAPAPGPPILSTNPSTTIKQPNRQILNDQPQFNDINKEKEILSNNSKGYVPFENNNNNSADGVRYRFISDETIGGKSDNSSTSKFKCFSCTNCSVM